MSGRGEPDGPPMSPRRARRIAEWHDWYRDLLPSLPAMSPDEIVIAWLAQTRPNVWRLAWGPSPAERAAWPGLYVQGALGDWWGPEGLAQAHAQAFRQLQIPRPMPPGEPGYYLRAPIGQVASLSAVAILTHGWDVRSRLKVPVAPADGPDQELALGNVLGMLRQSLAHVSLRKGSAQPTPPPDWDRDPALWTGPRRRSGVQRASLARALLIRGLVGEGVSHRPAIRLWLRWEIELSGPWSGHSSTRAAWELLQESRRYFGGTPHAKGKLESKGSRDPLYALREFEQDRMGSDRQIWAAIGIHPESPDLP